MKPTIPRPTSCPIKPRDTLSLHLPSGRLLSYAEYGCPTGFPLLYFHGFPASRLEAIAFHRPAAHRNLRILALDRPGFGQSTFQPGRRITDFPADVKAFAEQLQLKRFAAIGVSGGGPYALACAHKLPRNMLAAAGMAASAGPWESGYQDMPWLARGTAIAAAYWPAGLRISADALVGVARWCVSTDAAKTRIDAWLEGIKREREDGEEDMTTAERRDRLIRALFDGFTQGAEGMVHEAQLLSSLDWGFRLEDVEYQGVKLWHGTKDTNSPVRQVRYMAEKLQNSVLKEFEGGTHYTMAKHIDDILADLVPEEVVLEQ
jgi:pimeloyl-ACP methyl ester carboxylesterase